MHTTVQHPFIKWLKQRANISVTLLCAVVILAACGGDSGTDNSGDDEGHVFVTDRKPTDSAAESTIVPTAEETVRASEVPTIPPDELLVVRGAPQFVYLVIDDVLTVYDANVRSSTPVLLPENLVVMDYSASPTGDRVGVLGIQDGSYVVLFLGADGQPLGDPTALQLNFTPTVPGSPVASPVATPISTATPSLHIDWVPQGNGVLVSGPGVLLRVSMSGSIMPVSRAGANGTVTNALWSPMDSQVVLQTQQMDGHQAIFVLNSGADDVSEIDVLHDSTGQSITNLQWLPTGLGLVLVAGGVDNGVVMNGQLYLYRFGEPVPTLVATSGQGGPQATISHASVSPDGSSIAYAVMVRDGDDWHLHSLWIKPIAGGTGLSIPITSSAPIIRLEWSAEGLVWQQADGTMRVVDGSLQPRVLGEAPSATPLASPVASPSGTPAASPVVEPTPRG